MKQHVCLFLALAAATFASCGTSKEVDSVAPIDATASQDAPEGDAGSPSEAEVGDSGPLPSDASGDGSWAVEASTEDAGQPQDTGSTDVTADVAASGDAAPETGTRDAGAARDASGQQDAGMPVADAGTCLSQYNACCQACDDSCEEQCCVHDCKADCREQEDRCNMRDSGCRH
jgi:hypothetical protein